MLKKRGILVLLMCKLEALNFFFETSLYEHLARYKSPAASLRKTLTAKKDT